MPASLGSTFFNVKEARKSASKASGQIIEGQERASDFLERSRVENLERLDPFIGQSSQALEQQNIISGVAGPEAQQKFFDEFQFSPFAKFQREEGLKVAGQSDARLGTLKSGSRLKSISKFINDLTSREVNTRFDQAGAIVGTGLTATGAATGVDTGARSGQAQLAERGGLTRGDATLARSRALQSGVADFQSKIDQFSQGLL